MSLHRNFFIRQIQVRPRLFLAAALSGLVIAFLPEGWVDGPTMRMLIGWNSGVWFYVGLVAAMMTSSSPDSMRHRAKVEDEGQLTILFLVVVAAVASLAAIVVQLAMVKNMPASDQYLRIGLAGGTILSSWVFTHLMFALHYAHDYYLEPEDGQGQVGGLDFPGTPLPRYGDFVYFAFVIGTSAQTADVGFTNAPMRRIGLIHCVLSFLFNTTLLALTINIAASML